MLNTWIFILSDDGYFFLQTMDRHSSDYYDEQEYNIFSQETSYPLTAPSLSTPRGPGLQNLDLNSQADGFPHMDSYIEIPQSEKGDSEARLPPLPPRSSQAPFQPPRQGGGGRGPGRGACQAAGRQGHRNSRNSLNSRAAAGRVPQEYAPPA